MRGALLGQLGQDAFQNWIDPLVFVGAEQGVVHLRGADQLHRHLGVAELWRRDPPPALQGRDRGQPARVRRGAARGAGARPAGAPVAAVPRRCAGGAGRRSAGLAARRALHLRQLRRRQAERAGACRGAAGGRRAAPVDLQPALPLRRRGPGQDAPDARDRLGGEAADAGGAGAVPLGRAVHVPLRLGAALQGHARLQGDVPLGRHADGRRRAVHLRQGLRRRRSSSTPSTR